MANGDEKFNVGGVKGKMTVIEGYFSDFATTLSDINAFVRSLSYDEYQSLDLSPIESQITEETRSIKEDAIVEVVSVEGNKLFVKEIEK